MGKHFKCRVYTGGWRSFEAAIVKKSDHGFDKSFCKMWNNLVLVCNNGKRVVIEFLRTVLDVISHILT